MKQKKIILNNLILTALPKVVSLLLISVCTLIWYYTHIGVILKDERFFGILAVAAAIIFWGILAFLYLFVFIFDYFIYIGKNEIKTFGFLLHAKNYNKVRIDYSQIKSIDMILIVTPWEKNTKRINWRVTNVKLVDHYIRIILSDNTIKEIYINDFKLKNVELILNTIVERMKSCGNENYKNIDVKKIFEEFSSDPNCYLD